MPPADLVVYGMGELQIVEIAKRLQAGEDIRKIRDIPGTVWKMEVKAWKELKEKSKGTTEAVVRDTALEAAEFFKEYIEIPSFSEVSQDKAAFAKAFRTYFPEQNPITGKGIVQPHPKTVYCAEQAHASPDRSGT